MAAWGSVGSHCALSHKQTEGVERPATGSAPQIYAKIGPELLEMPDEGLVLAARAKARLGQALSAAHPHHLQVVGTSGSLPARTPRGTPSPGLRRKTPSIPSSEAEHASLSPSGPERRGPGPSLRMCQKRPFLAQQLKAGYSLSSDTRSTREPGSSPSFAALSRNVADIKSMEKGC